MALINNRYTFYVFIFLLAGIFQNIKAQSITEKIDSFIRIMMEKGNVPGLSVAVVHGDSILLSRGYGMASDGAQVTADTPFGIASLSKAFTATLVMQLVESGKVDLDAPIDRYIPSFVIDDPRSATITVRQLLNQTSGLGDRGFPEMAFYEQPQSLNEAVGRIRAAKLVSEPGKEFHYHNPNYQLLAALVEAVTNKKYSDYLEEHLCKPLGMKNTRDFSLTNSMYPGKENFKNGHIFFLGKPIEIKEPDWFVDGAAGIVSTSNDMARWLILQVNNGRYNDTHILCNTGVNVMRASVNKTLRGYGMGWFLNQDSSLYHGGILWTYSAEEMIYPKEGYGIVVLFNGGMNVFTDYYSFVSGIHDILMHREPEVPALPYWVYAALAGIIFLLMIALSARSLWRTDTWLHNYRSRARWKSITMLLVRVLPFLLLIFVPALITLMSGRVLSWHRVFLMFPDLIVGLGIIALLNLWVVLMRFIMLFKRGRS